MQYFLEDVLDRPSRSPPVKALSAENDLTAQIPLCAALLDGALDRLHISAVSETFLV